MALVLVVDDEPLMRRTVRTTLEKAGHQVEEAQDGNEGLRKFRENKPDLVVTDIIMPDREGVETVGAMRQLDADLPIIAMSGGGSVGGNLFLDLAQRLGATRTITKPFRNAELVQMVDDCLNAARTDR